jgi:uncharacterized membrane protein
MNLPPEDPNLTQEPEKQENNPPQEQGGDLPLEEESQEQEGFEASSPADPDTPLSEIYEEADSLDEPEFDFSALEANARANIEELGFAPLPEIERPAAVRRRRARQPLIARPSEEEVPDRLESMASRAIPTFDFFVFALIAGSLMGIGYLLNAPAILLLAIVLAPFPAPWVGVSLAAATGESRFFGQTLGGFFTAILIIFITGLLSGLASRIFMPLVLDQAYLHARLWWPDLLLVAIATISLLILFIQNDDKPVLPGLILNYSLLLPIGAAGFGLGNGTPGMWPQALAIFLVHLALSIVLALAIFYYMGFRPLESIGYAWGAGVILVSLMVVVGFAGLGTLVPVPQPTQAAPSATPTLAPATPSLAPVIAASSTPTPVPPSATPAPSLTPTASITPIVIPTTAYGRIQSRADGDGATIRTSPGGSAITTILNGYVVEILPDEPVTLDGNVWIKVKVTTSTRVIEGWVLQSLVVTPTPQP